MNKALILGTDPKNELQEPSQEGSRVLGKSQSRTCENIVHHDRSTTETFHRKCGACLPTWCVTGGGCSRILSGTEVKLGMDRVAARLMKAIWVAV